MDDQGPPIPFPKSPPNLMPYLKALGVLLAFGSAFFLTLKGQVPPDTYLELLYAFLGAMGIHLTSQKGTPNA